MNSTVRGFVWTFLVNEESMVLNILSSDFRVGREGFTSTAWNWACFIRAAVSVSGKIGHLSF